MPATLRRCGVGSRMAAWCRYHIPGAAGQNCLSSQRLHCAPNPRRQRKSRPQLGNTRTPVGGGVRLRGQAPCGCGPPVGLGAFP